MFVELSKVELEFIDVAMKVATKSLKYWNWVKNLFDKILKASKEEENSISRVEVIDDNWRSYTNWWCKSVKISMQDDNRTMKVFINR